MIRDQFEIVDTDDPQAAWEKLRDGIEQLVSGAETDEPAERLAAMVARPLGIEPADEFTVGAGFDGEDPRRRATGCSPPLGGRGHEPAPSARARVRGHPLGGRGNAGPDRVPGPLGPRPCAADLPGARRAARSAAGVRRRRTRRRSRSSLPHRRAGARLDPISGTAGDGNGLAEVALGGRALGRCSRGDGRIREEGTVPRTRSPTPCTRC